MALLWPHNSRRSNKNLMQEEYHVTSVRWLKDALQLRYMSVSESPTHFETLTESSFNNLTCRKGRVFIVSLCGAHGCSWLTAGHGMSDAKGNVEELIPVAGRCKGWVCGSSHSGMAYSNPAKVLGFCLL